MSKSKNKIISKKSRLFIILGILLLIIICSIILFGDYKKNTDDLSDKVKNVIPKESPYNLDEIYEMIKDGYILKCHRIEENQDRCNEFATVLFNFYNYFNEDTKFLAASLVDKEKYEIIEYDYFTYEDYQKVMHDEFFQVGKNDCLSGKVPGMCVPMARHFIQAFADVRDEQEQYKKGKG